MALRNLQRVAAQIVAVQLDQVEGVEEHGAVVAAIADAIKLRDAAVVASHRFTVVCGPWQPKHSCVAALINHADKGQADNAGAAAPRR